MNYEKAYKEALERARTFSQRWQGIEATDSELALQELKEIFPELRESEDEKIRKELISFITDRKNWFPKEETKASWIAWLEKQCKQKPYPETLDKAIELYYYSYGNGKDGFDNLSLENFKDIIKTFFEDYGKKSSWSEEDEELTEFEKELAFFSLMCKEQINPSCYNDLLKKTANNLLDLARKELESNYYDKVLDDRMVFKSELHATDLQTAYDMGKQDALKDLPKWKKVPKTWNVEDNQKVVFSEDYKYYMDKKELFNKLPKE